MEIHHEYSRAIQFKPNGQVRYLKELFRHTPDIPQIEFDNGMVIDLEDHAVHIVVETNNFSKQEKQIIPWVTEADGGWSKPFWHDRPDYPLQFFEYSAHQLTKEIETN